MESPVVQTTLSMPKEEQLGCGPSQTTEDHALDKGAEEEVTAKITSKDESGDEWKNIELVGLLKDATSGAVFEEEKNPVNMKEEKNISGDQELKEVFFRTRLFRPNMGQNRPNFGHKIGFWSFS